MPDDNLYNSTIDITLDLQVEYNLFESNFHVKLYDALKIGHENNEGKGYIKILKSDDDINKLKCHYQELLQLTYHATHGIISSNTLTLKKVEDSYIVDRINIIVLKEIDLCFEFDFYKKLKELITTNAELVRLGDEIKNRNKTINNLQDSITEKDKTIKAQEIEIKECEAKINQLSQNITRSSAQNNPASVRNMGLFPAPTEPTLTNNQPAASCCSIM